MTNLTKIAALPMAGGAMASLPAEVGKGKNATRIFQARTRVFLDGDEIDVRSISSNGRGYVLETPCLLPTSGVHEFLFQFPGGHRIKRRAEARIEKRAEDGLRELKFYVVDPDLLDAAGGGE